MPVDLPSQPGPLVGRASELAALRERLARADIRLLTLVGPAGTGKTRLALEAAREVADAFEGGVFFVDLSPLSDPALVPSAIGQALGIREEPDRPFLEVLIRNLGSRQRTLLLLDNFEQLLPAAPRLSTLLEGCATIKLLVTSRSALNLRWEHEFSVLPLEVPNLADLPVLPSLARVASVTLFIQRTQRVTSNFQLDESNAPAVAEICTRLDGLPLAIELAAARTRVLPPHALLRRLEHRLSLLEGGSIDQPPRQRTLRGAVNWSYDLLSPAEQAMFRRLGVFVGGFALDAVREVCDPDGALGIDPLVGIESLIEKSLLRQQREAADNETEPRFTMLETIRAYAVERLRESGEQPVLRRRHATYYLADAEVALQHIKSTQQVVWLRSMEADHDNLRAALTWCQEQGEVELAIRAGGLLAWFWTIRGHVTEGRSRVHGLLAAVGDSPTSLRAEALRIAGSLALSQSDYVAARAHFEASLAIRRQSPDQAAWLGQLSGLGAACMQLGLPAEAQNYFEEALSIQQSIGDRVGMAESFNSLANLAHSRGDLERARYMYERSQELNRELGYRADVVDHNLGVLAEELGDLVSARQHLEDSVQFKRVIGDTNGLPLSLAMLAQVVAAQGDVETAQRLLAESLALRRSLGDRPGIAFALERSALVAANHGLPQRALRLAGAASALREAIGAQLDAKAQSTLESQLAPARKALSRRTADAASRQGREMSMDEAIDYASAADPPVARNNESVPGGLTPRELQVATLVARGLTNRQIATELVLSERTADVHVSNILGKLQLTSRAQIAAWVVSRQLLADAT